MWCTLIELADGPARTIVSGNAEVPPSRRTFVQGVLVRESPFGAELEDAPFVLEVCGLHYGLLGRFPTIVAVGHMVSRVSCGRVGASSLELPSLGLGGLGERT